MELTFVSTVLLLLYVSLLAAIQQRNLFWGTLPLTAIVFIHAITFFVSLPPSIGKWLLGLLLGPLALLLLALSPLQLLKAPPKHKLETSMEVLHDAGYDPHQPGARVDIVAVHGLGSKSATAWSHKASKAIWLKDFLPKDIPNARIMTFNHNSNWERESPEKSLSDYSDELLKDLDKHRTSEEQKRRPLIFIGYSFGGLIVKDALVRSATENIDITNLVKGIIFLGTPHGGSPMTVQGRIKSLFSYWAGARPEHFNILESNSKERIRLSDEYIETLKKNPDLQHFDFYETIPEQKFGLKSMPAPKSVATIDPIALDLQRCSIENRALDATHRELHKFESKEDPRYKLVMEKLKNMSERTRERVQDGKEEQRRTKVREWLQPTSFDATNQRYENEFATDTCKWILERRECHQWRNQQEHHTDQATVRKLLFIAGKVGCGKTFIAQFLRKRLQTENSKTAVIYFYFDSKQIRANRNTALSFLRTVLYQLLTQPTAGDVDPRLEGAVFEGYRQVEAIRAESQTEACDQTSLLKLKDVIVRLLEWFPNVRLVIDALDECLPGIAERELVNNFLRKAAKVSSFSAVITTRPDPAIEKTFGGLTYSITITQGETNDDILRYIDFRVRDQTKLNSVEVRGLLEKELPAKAEGSFLYVRLLIDRIEQYDHTRRIADILKNLPGTLEDLYENALGLLVEDDQYRRCDQRRLPTIVSIFTWLLTAHQPLTVSGLHVALRADNLLEHDTLGDSFGDPEKAIREYAFPLVEVLSDKTVQLVHFSVTEFFAGLVHRGGTHTASKKISLHEFYYYPASANIKVALTCISYISSARIREADMAEARKAEALNPKAEDYDFLTYAISEWPYHTSKAGEEAEPHRERLLKFCSPENLPVFSTWIRDRAILDSRFRIAFRISSSVVDSPLPTPLHIAAYCGLHTLGTWILEEGYWDVGALDGTRATPLHAAAEQGCTEVVTVFLTQMNAEQFRDYQDQNGQTALHRAAVKGWTETTNALIDGGVTVDVSDKLGRSALFLASLYGKREIVDILITAGADAGRPSASKDTALTAAISNGHTEVLGILLSAMTELKSLPSSALNTAARRGYKDIVQRLIDSGVDINAVDDVKQTALHAASTTGREGVVQMLLENNACVDAQDQSGRTSLYFAAEQGQLGVVKILLKGRANVQILDRRNQTVLFKPAGRDHVGVVKALLEAEVDIHQQDYWGRTALLWSSLKGRSRTAEVLIDARADINVAEWEGQTPLHWAAKVDGFAAIPVLLRRGAKMETPDKYGFLPIHWAALGGHKEALSYLLNPYNIYPDPEYTGKEYLNHKTHAGEVPLHLTARSGHAILVRMLLDAGAKVDEADMRSQTALHQAAWGGHQAVVEVLLDAGSDPTATDAKRQTPLHLAARNGFGRIVDLLMEKAPRTVTMEDYKNRRPFDRARTDELTTRMQQSFNVEWEVVLSELPALHTMARTGDSAGVDRLLHDQSDIDLDALDGLGRTALHWAGEGGHDNALQSLLKAGAKANTADRFGRTVMHLKTASGSILRSLLDHGADANVADELQQCPLHQAARNGNTAVIKQLLESGVRLDVKDHKGRTPLHLMAQGGHTNAVSLLLGHQKTGIHAADDEKRTPLHIAAVWGHHEIISLLLEAGANPLDQDSQKRLPLHLAAGSGQELALKALLRPEIRNSLTARDTDHEYAIHKATVKGHINLVRMLLDLGMDIRAQNGLEQTVLHMAAKEGHENIIRMVLEHYATDLNLNTRDYWQKTPLQWAAENGLLESVRLLIDAGYNIMEVGDRQDTPLHLAVENGHAEVVDLLLTRGAFVDAALYQTRRTPLHIAADKSLERIVQILLKDGASTEAVDNRRDTALHIAVRRGNLRVVEELLAAEADPTLKNAENLSPAEIARKEVKEDIYAMFVKSVMDEERSAGYVVVDPPAKQ